MIKVGFFVAGLKGADFLASVADSCLPSFVSSYPVKGTLDDSFAKIKKYCSDRKITFLEPAYIADNKNSVPEFDLGFVVGWQFLLKNIDDRYVVFHDSLLPKYRGFAPVVSALMNGDQSLGVTAIQPSPEPDAGPIYSQAEVTIEYPIKISKTFELLGPVYARVAKDILTMASRGALVAAEQDHDAASYSLWRDEQDYLIDWSWDSNKLRRFVDALGWPYEGARTRLNDVIIVIDDVEELPDLNFVIRHPGKIWRLQEGCPHIVCGSGILKINSARFLDGKPVVFDRLRCRLV